jgi:hypothetical protein
MKRPEDMDEVLRALPGPTQDADAAEQIRLRARLALRRAPPSVLGRRLARGWDLAEPWLVASSVVLFLAWTFRSVAILYL